MEKPSCQHMSLDVTYFGTNNRLTFSKNTDTFAPKGDLTLPEDPEATVWVALITVPDRMDNL